MTLAPKGGVVGLRSLSCILLVCPLLLQAATPSPESKEAKTRLVALLDDDWEMRLSEDPLLATAVGDHRFDGQLPTVGAADEARRDAERRKLRRRLLEIDAAALDEGDRESYVLIRRELDDAIRAFELKTYRFPINADSGFHTEFARLADEVPLATTRDYENYIARLRAFPGFARQNTDLLREGLRTGWTLPRAVLAGYDGPIRAQIVASPEKSPLYAPFASFPPGVPEADRARLKKAGEDAIREQVLPAYSEFLEFMIREYIPGARPTVGASALPGGKEYYAFLVRHFTTLDVTPEQVHAIGLAEVQRIRAEMEAVIRETAFEGSFAEFLTFLRTDPRFYAKTPEELLKQAAFTAKRIDAKLPSLFGRLPRQPYGVEPVPADIAPKYTGGRYVPAPLDGKKAGTYWVNTYALESRPLYVLDALTLHEAVPGHHLQIALAKELQDLPKFRRVLYIEAFGEGWGLYSERLGLEIGLYADPYSRFGRLTYEMWRACRLVVDTGLHAMGWSRQQAIDYLSANTALSLHECTTETDRYISWPGQALAYKMGELKIRELRKRAEEALGPRFDVREFHDRVLSGGTVTLPVLEERIDAWIRSVKSAP
ncbi:MAG TPA: DUF885 domain-containing protein [Thermoanaerobaculia bacterium]|nr:DUF885 domain-containing protein [Thermoanaerobaculia bacterium]